MDALAAPGDLNYLAVLAGTIAFFAVGGLWYSPILFAKTWQSTVGLSDADVAGRNMGAVFGSTFVVALVTNFVLALFLGNDAGLGTGALAGLLAGLGLSAAPIVTTFIFENRPVKLMLIDGGYHVCAMTIAGAIIGAWQ
jgi:Protein of unknown function (DUF1761)